MDPLRESTATTKDQLLDAAERLIAEQGIDGASVRAITEAARANVAAPRKVSFEPSSNDDSYRSIGNASIDWSDASLSRDVRMSKASSVPSSYPPSTTSGRIRLRASGAA